MRDLSPIGLSRAASFALWIEYEFEKPDTTGKDRAIAALVWRGLVEQLEALTHMKSFLGRTFYSAMIVAAVSGSATFAIAQESTNQVAVKTDWSVFTEESPKECWGVSSPKETVNTRDGAPVSVRRGDILLFVTFRPGGAGGEVSFSGGYPFAAGSTVKVDISGTTFDMVTDGEWAWTVDANADAAILAALKGGETAVLSAASGKGTKTQDTFSLRGFTAAMDEAASRCK